MTSAFTFTQHFNRIFEI